MGDTHAMFHTVEEIVLLTDLLNICTSTHMIYCKGCMSDTGQRLPERFAEHLPLLGTMILTNRSPKVSTDPTIQWQKWKSIEIDIIFRADRVFRSAWDLKATSFKAPYIYVRPISIFAFLWQIRALNPVRTVYTWYFVTFDWHANYTLNQTDKNIVDKLRRIISVYFAAWTPTRQSKRTKYASVDGTLLISKMEFLEVFSDVEKGWLLPGRMIFVLLVLWLSQHDFFHQGKTSCRKRVEGSSPPKKRQKEVATFWTKILHSFIWVKCEVKSTASSHDVAWPNELIFTHKGDFCLIGWLFESF